MYTIEKLEKWLKKPGNKAKITSYFGYTTTETVSVWIRKYRIPIHQELRVEKFLKMQKKGKNKNGNSD